MGDIDIIDRTAELSLIFWDRLIDTENDTIKIYKESDSIYSKIGFIRIDGSIITEPIYDNDFRARAIKSGKYMTGSRNTACFLLNSSGKEIYANSEIWFVYENNQDSGYDTINTSYGGVSVIFGPNYDKVSAEYDNIMAVNELGILVGVIKVCGTDETYVDILDSSGSIIGQNEDWDRNYKHKLNMDISDIGSRMLKLGHNSYNRYNIKILSR